VDNRSKRIEGTSRLKARVFREVLRAAGASDSNVARLNFGEIQSDIKSHRGVKYSNAQSFESMHDRDHLPEIHAYTERYLFSVENVTLDTATGILFSDAGKIIEESTSWPASNILLNSIPKPPSKGVPHIGTDGRCTVSLPANGFYHWLIEDLGPFIFAVQNSEPSLALIYERAGSYLDSVLPLIDAEFLRVPRFVHLDNYTFTSKGSDTGWPHQTDISTLRSFLAAYIREREEGKRIYISRLDSSRSPNFEKTLVSRLREEGWEILNTERMSLADQVNTISSASILCGVHGAGLAGMIWMAPGSQVIELGPRRFVPCFSRLSHIHGSRHQLISFEDPQQKSVDEIHLEIVKSLGSAE